MANTMTIAMPADTSIVSLGKTPLLGGQGRNGFAHVATPAAGVMLQGHDAPGNSAPASGDAGWYTLLTMTTTSAKIQEIVLPRWIRRGAAGGTDPITIEGVQ